MKLDYSKLPPLVADILTTFLQPITIEFDISDLFLLNMVNVKLAQFFSSKRLKFEGNKGEALINYYAIGICPSGGGKDIALNMLNKHIFKNFYDSFYEERDIFTSKKEYDIVSEACSRYKKNETKQKAYVEDKMGEVRTLHVEERPKTPEGFYASCVGFLNYGKGSVFVRDSEFAKTLKDGNPSKLSAIGIIMEAFEGDLSIETTKGERNSQRVTGIPINIAYLTEGSRLTEDPKTKEIFTSSLQNGYARRSNVSYQAYSYDKQMPLSFKEYQRMNDMAVSNGKKLMMMIEAINKKIPFGHTFKMTNGAKELLYNYNKLCHKQSKEFSSSEKDVVLVDIRQRFWKAYKLAALIACFNSKDLTVTEEEATMAIYQVELFHESFKQYIGARPKSDHEKVYFYLCKHKDKWVTKKDLREQSFVYHGNFKTWWESVKDFVEQTANERGFTLADEKFGKNGIKYRLVENKLGQELREEYDMEESMR